MPYKKRFTLIELVIVVFFISLLASMLLLTLERSRDEANAVKCKSNLTQIGIMLNSYAFENDGLMPPGEGTAGNVPTNVISHPDRGMRGLGQLYSSPEEINYMLFCCPQISISRHCIYVQNGYEASYLENGFKTGKVLTSAYSYRGYFNTDRKISKNHNRALAMDFNYDFYENDKHNTPEIMFASASGSVSKVELPTGKPDRKVRNHQTAWHNPDSGFRLNILYGNGEVRTVFCNDDSFVYKNMGPKEFTRVYENADKER